MAANQKLHLKIGAKYPSFYPRMALIALTPDVLSTLQDNRVNTMAADALAPSVTRPSAATVLTWLEKQILVFTK